MATVLDQYNQKKVQISAQIAAGKFPAEQMLQYQEMLYRIDVLETCMSFCRTAPVTADQRVLGNHYRLFDCFLNCVLQERQFGFPTDEKGQKQRETAFNNFLTVVNSFRKKFQSFAPKSQDEYRNIITQMIETILPAWMSYRNTFVRL